MVSAGFWRVLVAFLAVVFSAGAVSVQNAGSGVSVFPETAQAPGPNQALQAELRLEIPEGSQVYAAKDHFFELVVTDSEGLGEVTLSIPEPVIVPDALGVGETDSVPVYAGAPVFGFSAPLRAARGESWQMDVRVSFQTCTQTLCYPPETHRFRWQGSAGDSQVSVIPVSGAAADQGGLENRAGTGIPGDFEVTARTSGYMGKNRFLQFLAEGRGQGEGKGNLSDVLQNGSVLLGLLLVLAAGVALNLTPCVLPMIPVNLAIIGAGSQASSRLRGFFMGGLYGLAIALTYGVLGLVVVLGGGTFGSINASPVFNGGIAILFFVLAAAMLGLFNIDFSRFSSGLDIKRWKGAPALLAGGMGVVTAVLAGACVAPVVIAVVLVSTRQYAAGNTWALLYPFVLGLGMGLPWPVAGAGLSFLPKPGGWMKWVKIIFGLFFIGLGIYYGALGYRLWQAQRTGVETGSTKPEFWVHSLEEGFETARKTGKPVLLDFATPWCKTCHAMDRTTLALPEVQRELRRFVPVICEMDDLEDPESAALLEELGVIGFPTYIVLQRTDE